MTPTLRDIYELFSGWECERLITQKLPAPNKKTQALALRINCGATSSYVTQIAIAKNSFLNEKEIESLKPIIVLDNDHDAAPVAKHGSPEVRMKWINDHQLEIQYHAKARSFAKETLRDKIQICYKTFDR